MASACEKCEGLEEPKTCALQEIQALVNADAQVESLNERALREQQIEREHRFGTERNLNRELQSPTAEESIITRWKTSSRSR